MIVARRSVSAGDMPAAGSSRSSSRGCAASAIATSSWRCSPCESAAAGRAPEAVEPDALEQRVGLRGQRARAAAERTPRVARAPLQRQQHVLAAAQRREQARVLERLRDAEPHALVLGDAGDVAAVEADVAGRHRLRAQDQLEQRALAGAVGADQPVPRARLDVAGRRRRRRAGRRRSASTSVELEQRGHPGLRRSRARPRRRSRPGSR